MARNEKGEDWSKFMKEMNELGPALRDDVEKGANGLYAADGSSFKPAPAEITGPNGELLITKEKLEAQEKKRQKNLKKRAKKKIPGYDKEIGGMPLHVLKRVQKMAPFVTANKQKFINKWFDEEMLKLLPKWCVKRIGKKGKMPWYLWFIKLKIQHVSDPLPWGQDFLAIYVFGKPHARTNFLWSDK